MERRAAAIGRASSLTFSGPLLAFNLAFLGPPGTGKPPRDRARRACQAGHRVLFATASEWVARLADAHSTGTLQRELVRLGRTRSWSSTYADTVTMPSSAGVGLVDRVWAISRLGIVAS